MSENGNADEVVTSTASGVTVAKSFEGEEFTVPAIKFAIRSDREDAASLRLTDHIPDEFPMDNVGFHPDFENDNWTAYKDHRVQFERELDPGEEIVTVYGVRLSEGQDAAAFLEEADIEEVAPVEPNDSDGVSDEDGGLTPATGTAVEENTIVDIVSEDSSQLVRDVIAGEDDLHLEDDDVAAASEPAGVDGGSDPLATPDADPTDDAIDDRDEADPLGGSSDDVLADRDDADGSAEATDDSGPETILESGADEDDVPGSAERSPATSASDTASQSVAAALADEIREGDVDDDDLELIQQELDVETPESTNVRIRHLQSRVDDLSAYTEALEEFIDDNGTAEEVVGGFEDEIEDLREAIDEFETDVEAARHEGSQAREQVAELADDVETVEAELDALGNADEELDRIESELGEMEELVGANTEDVSALDGEVTDLRSRLEATDGTEEELDRLSGEIADLSDEMSSMEADIGDRIEDVASDVEAINDELAEIREWRSELTNVFGN